MEPDGGIDSFSFVRNQMGRHAASSVLCVPGYPIHAGLSWIVIYIHFGLE